MEEGRTLIEKVREYLTHKPECAVARGGSYFDPHRQKRCGYCKRAHTEHDGGFRCRCTCGLDALLSHLTAAQIALPEQGWRDIETEKPLARMDSPGEGDNPRTAPDVQPDSGLVQVETCVCAAVSTPNGSLFTGKRHHHCIALAHAAGFGRVPQDWQGFLTTRGRFVDRREAFMLQQAAGVASVAPDGYRGEVLFSEDLY